MAQFEVVCSSTNGSITLNYNELKTQLQEELKKYKMVVTDDNLPEAKTNRAKLNNLGKALNAKKIEVKKAFTQPYTDFETQIKDLQNMISDASNAIDVQVKEFEEREKTKKKQEIFNAWLEVQVYDVPLEKFFNDKWLNKGYKLEDIKTELKAKADEITQSIEHLNLIYKDPLDNAEAKGIYLDCLSLPQATMEIDKRLKYREEYKKRKQETLEHLRNDSIIAEPEPQQIPQNSPVNVQTQEPEEQPVTIKKKRIVVEFVGNEAFFSDMNAIIRKHKNINLYNMKIKEREDI